MKFDFEKEDFINTLQEMLQDYGRMVLSEGKKCYSLWLDYAPQLSEEGELLKVFLEQGLGKQVVELKNCSAEKRAEWRMQAIEKMVRTGEAQKDALSLVDAVLDALGWDVKQEQTAQVKLTSKVIKTVEVEQTKEEGKIPKEPSKHNKDVDQDILSKQKKDISLKSTQPIEPTEQYIRFGPEEKIVYLNKHLPQVQGFCVYIIPNNITNWKRLSKYTTNFPRGFQLVSSSVESLGINTSDMVLGIVTEETMLRGNLKRALVFSDECIYQINAGCTWKVRYKEIERTELQNNRIVLWMRSGAREYVEPFHFEFNTRELHSLIRTLIDGEIRRTETVQPNSQCIESPRKMFPSPYYAKASGLKPGDAVLCRTTSRAGINNYMKECTYISQARKVKVLGKTGNALYVELAEDCQGWVFANVMKEV